MRVCTICNHLKVAEINTSLIDNGPLRTIADRWSVSKTSLLRHKTHLPAALMKSKRAQEEALGDKLLDRVQAAEGRSERLYAAAEQILQRALEEDSPRTALQAIKAAVDVMGEARQYLQLRGELTGELRDERGGPGSNSSRGITIVFPVMSKEDQEAVDNAVTIDLPAPPRRMLNRPSDGKPL